MLTDKERKAIIESDPSTFLSHTHSVEGGRFAKINKEIVIGSAPTPSSQYPAGPNWSVDPTGVEPPLSLDVNALDPVGETKEIEASLVRHTDCSSCGDGDGEVSPAPDNPILSGGLPTSPGGRRFLGSSSPSTTSTLKRRRL